jgi:predicted transcriptional regulator
MTNLYSIHLLRHLRLTIRQNIHALRRDKKMPLGVLSELASVPREKLDYYEIGRCEITLEHILRIACALETDARSLMQ